MTEEEIEINRKVKRASQLLFFQRHKKPGIRGWELKRALGKDFLKIINILNDELEKIDLKIKIVFEEANNPKEPSEDELDRARYFVIMRDPLNLTDLISSGLRIDDVAVLAATIAFIISRQGKAPRNEVEQLLGEKFPKWKVDMNLDRFIRSGYLSQDEGDVLHIDWRTRAEIDQKALIDLILSK